MGTNYILQYHKQISAGKIVAPSKIIKVYGKIVSELQNKGGKYTFDLEAGSRAIEFIETFCKQSQGTIGEQLELMLWQKALIQTIFGFKDSGTGYRKYREAFVLVGRKNGKSTLLSAISLYMLIADKEGAAEVYSVATKLDQAKRILTEAHNMVKQSPELRALIRKRRNDMYFPWTSSVMMALASQSKSLDGLNTHLGVIDECHAITDRNLYEVIKQSMQSRRQPLLFIITTAGTVRENIYDNLYDYANKVANGDVDDDTFLPILYELDNVDEWSDPQLWVKANPALGLIKSVKGLTDEVERAKNDTEYLSGVLCKHFNLKQTSSHLWLSFEKLNNEKTYTDEQMSNVYCIGGADLSSTTDLTCATLLAEVDGEILVKQMYWLPQTKLEERVREDKIPYDKWVQRGIMRTCEGSLVNYHDVTLWFKEQVERYELRPLWIGYDSWNANYWHDEMQGEGFQMVEVRQGAKTMSQPMKQMEADLSDKKINYNNNPILKWCLSNTAIKSDDNGNIRPSKGNGTRARIDGTVSLIDAYVVLQDNYQNYKNML